MGEVSIDSLQQQVRTFKGKDQEVHILLQGGQILPHADDLYPCPPWDLSVPVLISLVIFLLLLC